MALRVPCANKAETAEFRRRKRGLDDAATSNGGLPGDNRTSRRSEALLAITCRRAFAARRASDRDVFAVGVGGRSVVTRPNGVVSVSGWVGERARLVCGQFITVDLGVSRLPKIDKLSIARRIGDSKS